MGDIPPTFAVSGVPAMFVDSVLSIDTGVTIVAGPYDNPPTGPWNGSGPLQPEGSPFVIGQQLMDGSWMLLQGKIKFVGFLTDIIYVFGTTNEACRARSSVTLEEEC
jgi:hypothetical protein